MCCCLEELRCVCILWQVSPAVLAAFPSAFLIAAATFLFRNIFLWLVEKEITKGKKGALPEHACDLCREKDWDLLPSHCKMLRI